MNEMEHPNWETIKEYEDITFRKADGVARIAFNRPECRNAFRPKTVSELQEALIIAHEDQEIGVVLHQKMGFGHFARVVTNVCAQLQVTKVKMVSIVSIFLMSSARFVS